MANCHTIIVGAGSAGCLLAHLLAGQGISVTLIEPPSMPAAKNDRQRPARWLNLLGSADDWDFPTSAVDRLAGRSLRWPRGRGLGGSCRINAMIWFPPQDEDLREFASASRWSLTGLQEAYREVGAIVMPESPRWLSESSKRFLEAAESLPNSQPMVYQRVNRNGRRWNPAALLDGCGVNVIRAGVARVIFDDQQVTGVQVVGGETISCDGQVILSAGAIGSPLILMRSGIGPPDLLRECNIDVRVDAPAVGANLQDHIVMPVIFGVDPAYRFGSRSSVREIARWQTVGGGPLSSNIAECGGLFRGGRCQIHVTPTHYLAYPGSDETSAMTIAVDFTKPKSRGRLRIHSADPIAPPIIEPNYLSDETDLQITIDGVRLAREIAQLPPLSDWTTGELLPGRKRDSNESIARSIRRFAQTLYHPTGTCAVGDVVDDGLVVRGVENLRVIDASALNNITVGNPNAMVMTIATRAAGSMIDDGPD